MTQDIKSKSNAAAGNSNEPAPYRTKMANFIASCMDDDIDVRRDVYDFAVAAKPTMKADSIANMEKFQATMRLLTGREGPLFPGSVEKLLLSWTIHDSSVTINVMFACAGVLRPSFNDGYDWVAMAKYYHRLATAIRPTKVGIFVRFMLMLAAGTIVRDEAYITKMINSLPSSSLYTKFALKLRSDSGGAK